MVIGVLVLTPSVGNGPLRGVLHTIGKLKMHSYCIKNETVKYVCKWVIPPGWGTICDGVNCYIRKCTIYYP